MRLLLDTHVALWATLASRMLKPGERTLIEGADQIFVSVASIWEIAIKHRLRRGRPDDMPIPGREALSVFKEAGYRVLPVFAEHAAAVDDLPPIHADPFDRILVAQALTEPMRLLTRDGRLRKYGALVTVS